MQIKDKDGSILYESESETLSTGDVDYLDLRHAELAGFEFGAIMLTEVDLSYSNLAGADFYWGVLIDVDLSYANLENANFQGCDLARSKLKGANLRGANLGPSNLGGPSSISGCDLSGADLTNTKLDSAIYDDSTTFPDGFDPTSHGLIHSRDYDIKINAGSK